MCGHVEIRLFEWTFSVCWISLRHICHGCYSAFQSSSVIQFGWIWWEWPLVTSTTFWKTFFQNNAEACEFWKLHYFCMMNILPSLLSQLEKKINFFFLCFFWFCRKKLFNEHLDDPNYVPLPEERERPGGFNWGGDALNAQQPNQRPDQPQQQPPQQPAPNQ